MLPHAVRACDVHRPQPAARRAVRDVACGERHHSEDGPKRVERYEIGGVIALVARARRGRIRMRSPGAIVEIILAACRWHPRWRPRS